MNSPLRVGIIGANAHHGWAHDAHVPALRRLPQFTLTAVSARTEALAEEARGILGAQRAYADSLQLIQAPDVDIVTVTVRVPEHRTLVLAALAAGKHVYCEWPLGRTLSEADEMARAVSAKQHAIIGLQGLSAPAVRQAIKLVRGGALGGLRLLRVVSPTAGWGAVTIQRYAYLQDAQNGATLEAIAGGHTLAVMEAIVGSYVEVDARNSTLVPQVQVQGSVTPVARTCADHMMVLGKHDSGCVSILEVLSASSADRFLVELVGERGSLKITGGGAGGFQAGALKLDTSFDLEPTPSAVADGLGQGPATNVAESYARLAADIRSGAHTVPDFEAAVRLTRLLQAIEAASSTGMRQYLAPQLSDSAAVAAKQL